jgi:aspartate racemase
MSPRRIGILGGMGPEATVLLMQKLIAVVPAKDDADHIPLLVDQNTQVPSRIRRLIEGNGEDPGPVLAGMVRRLQTAGAEGLAMPCNTAHHYAPHIRSAASVPFIDMVALAIARARRHVRPGGKVGILASPAVQRIALFDPPLEAVGLRAAYSPDPEGMLAAIRTVKAGSPSAATRAALVAASTALLAQGATVQMIACTEFSLIPDAFAEGVEGFDTLDVLVDGIVAFALGMMAGADGAA